MKLVIDVYCSYWLRELFLSDISGLELGYIMVISGFEVQISSENDYCVTPLHVAAAFNNSAVVEILASNGGFLEPTTFYMLQTPLHYAARYDSPNSVRTLVKMGAKIEARYWFHTNWKMCTFLYGEPVLSLGFHKISEVSYLNLESNYCECTLLRFSVKTLKCHPSKFYPRLVKNIGNYLSVANMS